MRSWASAGAAGAGVALLATQFAEAFVNSGKQEDSSLYKRLGFIIASIIAIIFLYTLRKLRGSRQQEEKFRAKRDRISELRNSVGGGSDDASDSDSPLRHTGASAAATVVGLVTYPVKSCAAVPCERAQLSSRGLWGDRRWLVAKHIPETGVYKMLTQRQFPKLALIKPTIQSTRSMASIASSASTAKRGDDGIVGVVLVAPGQDEIVCPVITSRSTGSTVITACMWEEATPDRPTSWDDAQRVVDQGNEVASWLKGFLDTDEDVRLVYMDESSERKVNPKYAVDQQPSLVSFADGMQYLLASLTSLNELNRRLPASEGPLGMDRFRPNIIVDGSDPFEEDTWAEIQIGQRPDEFAPTFYGVKHCTRCVVPTTDQSTAEQGGAFAEPLKTLRTFRRDKGLSGKPVFGENLAHLESWDRGLAPSINIGDSVWVLRTKDRGEIGGKKASSGGCVIS